MRAVEIPALFDAHLHVRQGDMLRKVMPHTARCCEYALLMPNTTPALSDVPRVQSYMAEVRSAGLNVNGNSLNPLFTFKLLSNCTPTLIRLLKKEGVVAGKIYPEGVTTNSDDGISRELLRNPNRNLLDSYAEMEKLGMVLCIHGEMPGESCLDAEEKFINTVNWLRLNFPKLRIVMEHITTADAVNYIFSASSQTGNIAATITAHHLFLTIDDVVGAKIQPHNFCKPIAKRVRDRDALITAALSGNKHFFLGSDSAPHMRETKECECGCAGVYTAPLLPELMLEFFDSRGAMDKLPQYVAYAACDFYKVKHSGNMLRFIEGSQTIRKSFGGVVPFRAGQPLNWRQSGWVYPD